MDEAVRVRAAIAEAIKDMPDAPRELILRLAHDTALPVCEPVIRLSPLLTTEDLLALVARRRPPAPCSPLRAARGSRLPVSDAIAATADSRGDPRAARQPVGADPRGDARCAGGAFGRSPDWHEPLVRRPSLSPRSARMLSEIVATHLLEELAARADLAPALAEELRRRVASG